MEIIYELGKGWWINLNLFSEDSQMKSAQILDIKATVQDQLNGIQALKQQIDFLKTDKLNLQRELQQLQQDLEDSKNRLRVRELIQTSGGFLFLIPLTD